MSKKSIHGSTPEMPIPTLQDFEWQALLDGFLAFKQHSDGCRPRTIEAYGDVLGRLRIYFADRNPLAANEDELLAFSGPYLHKLGLGPASRTPYVACIREFYAWLERSGKITKTPAKHVPYPKKDRPLPRSMTLTSAEKLMWAPDFNTFEGVRDSAMLTLLIGCGLRVSGLIRLDQEDLIAIDLDKAPRLALKVVEKGGKERRIPIPREAELLLRIYLEHEELSKIDRLTGRRHVLFVSTHNRRVPNHEYHGEARRLSSKAVWNMIQKYGKKAGIPQEELHPHAMRHLFGTELAEGDVDLLVRQQLMGHSSPKSTEVYTHLAARKLIKVIDNANPLAKIKSPVSELLGRIK
jgi:integrase/recombinase XerD